MSKRLKDTALQIASIPREDFEGAAELLPRFEAEAKERQAAAGPKEGKGKKQRTACPTSGTSAPGRSSKQAAKAVGVSHSLVSRAKKIKEKAPEV